MAQQPPEQMGSSVSTTTPPVILSGERAPLCFGMTSDGRFYSFEEQYGRPAILILVGCDAVGDLAPVMGAFIPKLDAIAARNADLLVLTDINPSDPQWTAVVPPGIRMVDCGNFLSRCGVGPEDVLVLALDRTMRVGMLGRPGEHEDLAAACLHCLGELPDEEPRDVNLPVPLLMLPNLLPRDLCRALMAWFETRPSADGEVARIDALGQARGVIDHGKKRRRDVLIPPGEDLYNVLHEALLSRCAPEIRKAFQARIAHTDRILIARYDENAGWFRRHRDNAAENVAFRQFAISVNLNTEDHEGGHLLFPEYNDHRYRPPTGGGMIFSASILHEAAPVTRGSRYVLLTFFHDDAAEARRCAYFARMAATGNAACGAYA